ncbi:hypothetical protein M0805_003941 [Coniferiporia weirii]|nr:hypothetical protein M0805_003941 [Coniferiporia weirii]
MSFAKSLPGEHTVKNDDPFIYYHGRWDASPGTWWAGSGFKLNVEDLTSLKLNLGNHTTSPLVSVGVSLNYNPFFTVNISAGENIIPLDSLNRTGSNTVVRINSWNWQDNRVNLESIVLNTEAKLLPYAPSKLAFQFIGDSLSAGQYLPQGVDQAWPFLTGEFFKAEHVVVAQPGAALTDIVSYGNEHGMSFQFFRTEDTGYFYTTDHNYTTPWNFKRDIPAADVVIIHLGANDNGQNVPADEFVQNYLNFLVHLREIYVRQPILIFTPWGWPQPDGSIGYYYPGSYEEILSQRLSSGDSNTFLVNTTGWVTLEDIFPDNLHPTVSGHQKIAGLFETWLQEFGIAPEKEWQTALH